MRTDGNVERDAEGLRQMVWGNRFPVDPVPIARRLGMSVLDSPLDQIVAGACVKEVGRDPTILLNEADSILRKRFVCAHMLGHAIERGGDDQYDCICLRSSFLISSDPHEAYANAFAAALLMPPLFLARAHQEGKRCPELIIEFGVPQEVVHLALNSLNLVLS